MPQFNVDEDVAALVERLSQKKPFEHLSFNEALRRVLQRYAIAPSKKDKELEALFAEAMANAPKKAPTPSPLEWVATVSDLKGKRGLTTWKAICDLLKIDTAGDSARRQLKKWVSQNRPEWPAVPEV